MLNCYMCKTDETKNDRKWIPQDWIKQFFFLKDKIEKKMVLSKEIENEENFKLLVFLEIMRLFSRLVFKWFFYLAYFENIFDVFHVRKQQGYIMV